MSAAAELLRLQLRAAQGIISKMEIGTCRKMQDAIGKLWAGVLRDKVRFETVEGLPFPAEMAVPAGEPEPKDGGILYLHGGGYTAGGVEYARGFGSIMTEHTGYSTLCIEYRLAPEDPYPAALEDALTAYLYMLDNYAPEKIAVAGDSAGGGLCFCLMQKVKELKLPLPACIVAVSPWTDLTMRAPSVEENKKRDPSLKKETLDFYAGLYAEGRLEEPMVSPVYGDMSDMPPSVIFVGSDEILLDDSVRMAQKLKRAGRKCTLIVEKGMWHVYLLYGVPEAKKAISIMKGFLGDHIG